MEEFAIRPSKARDDVLGDGVDDDFPARENTHAPESARRATAAMAKTSLAPSVRGKGGALAPTRRAGKILPQFTHLIVTPA
jgi:hypothetical protein